MDFRKTKLFTMNLIKIGSLFGLVLLFLSSAFHPAKDALPGYLILENGKRLEGWIEPGSVTDNEVKVKFAQKGKAKSYKPKKVKAYGYEISAKNDVGKTVSEWIHYERQEVEYPPKPFSSTTVFMRREAGGELNIYSYYIEMRAKRDNPFQHSYYIKKKDGRLKEVKEKNFKRMSLEYFRNYKAMHSRIGDKQFQYKNLIRMVRDYNFWVENGHDSMEYKVSPENYDLN